MCLFCRTFTQSEHSHKVSLPKNCIVLRSNGIGSVRIVFTMKTKVLNVNTTVLVSSTESAKIGVTEKFLGQGVVAL